MIILARDSSFHFNPLFQQKPGTLWSGVPGFCVLRGVLQIGVYLLQKAEPFEVRRIAACCIALTMFARLQAEKSFLPRTRRGKKQFRLFSLLRQRNSARLYGRPQGSPLQDDRWIFVGAVPTPFVPLGHFPLTGGIGPCGRP